MNNELDGKYVGRHHTRQTELYIWILSYIEIYWQTQHRTDRDLCMDIELDRRHIGRNNTGQIYVWIVSYIGNMFADTKQDR